MPLTLTPLCNPYDPTRLAISGLAGFYEDFPTYSHDVVVIAHEFGHLLGSRHTHACAWNGNGTAIDGCVPVEGNCPNPGIPADGGTIMSYCHVTNGGINLSKGFGLQPGNLIRNNVANATCLSSCDTSFCLTPMGLSATSTYPDAILSWDTIAGAIDYDVRGRMVGDTIWDQGFQLSPPVSYQQRMPCTTYEFQVRSNCDGIAGEWSESFLFTTDGCGECSYALIDFEDFNAWHAGGWGIWNDGGLNCVRSFWDAPYASGGVGRCVRLQDKFLSANTYTNTLDLSAYEELTVSFTCYPKDLFSRGELFLQKSTDGGINYTTVASWKNGTDFTNDVRFDPSVVISGPFPADTRFRFHSFGKNSTNRFYIDDIEIAGCLRTSAVEIALEKELLSLLQAADTPQSISAPISNKTSSLKLFPNPTRDQLNVSFTLEEAVKVRLVLSDLAGKTLMVNTIDAAAGTQQTILDLSKFGAGIYFMTLVTKTGKETKKLIVQ